ncbi:unnamed protein product [Nezara viridula]|uniref:Uncharacterized protein n=1 Tax=Nezara viridula TaxID=85310 RepID=A0A9P0MQQ7_NEZVI|nr:unnamed protein product [Nezara viridula]
MVISILTRWRHEAVPAPTEPANATTNHSLTKHQSKDGKTQHLCNESDTQVGSVKKAQGLGQGYDWSSGVKVPSTPVPRLLSPAVTSPATIGKCHSLEERKSKLYNSSSY